MNTLWLPALLLAPALAVAQHAPSDPANPGHPVPAVAYRSVFADVPRGVEAETTHWPQANADVGQFRRGHIDILKWEADRAAGTPDKPTAPAAAHHPGHRSTP